MHYALPLLLEIHYITQRNYHVFAIIGYPAQTAATERAEPTDMQLFGTCLYCFVAVIETVPCDCPVGIVQSVLRLSPHKSEASRNSAQVQTYITDWKQEL
jgi:hypothetical protein